MKKIWLLYDECDYAVNRDYAELLHRLGQPHGFAIEPVLTENLLFGMRSNGTVYCLRDGNEARPEVVLSRQRSAFISRCFERMDVPVMNNSRVCFYANDKRETNLLLSGLPMPATLFLRAGMDAPPDGIEWPVVLKPACSHGGDRVTLAGDSFAWKKAISLIGAQNTVQQSKVSDAGIDLRVYIVFGAIVAGVMRRAKHGIVSNYKLGGDVALHEPDAMERALVNEVIKRFDAAGAPLCLAGVDLLYEHGRPVIGEVEDVVGSRMLYQVSDIDIAAQFLEALAARV